MVYLFIDVELFLVKY